MQWTAELDKAIAELHAKRLGNAFIAKWLRVNPSQLRARLIELGLAKSRSSAAARRCEAADTFGAAEAQDMAGASVEDEDDDLVSIDGCPRGHLLPERRIASIYRSVGRGY